MRIADLVETRIGPAAVRVDGGFLRLTSADLYPDGTIVHTVFLPDAKPSRLATSVGLDLPGMDPLELVDSKGTSYLRMGAAGVDFQDGTFVGTYAFHPGVSSRDVDLFVRAPRVTFELRRDVR